MSDNELIEAIKDLLKIAPSKLHPGLVQALSSANNEMFMSCEYQLGCVYLQAGLLGLQEMENKLRRLIEKAFTLGY